MAGELSCRYAQVKKKFKLINLSILSDSRNGKWFLCDKVCFPVVLSIHFLSSVRVSIHGSRTLKTAYHAYGS